MTISMSDLRTTRPDKPPRILIYGPQKIGKTTWASEAPNPVFLKLEEGDTEGVEMVGWSRYSDDGAAPIQTYNDVMDAIAALYDDHDFQTLVIDSASSLEPMIWAETCRRNGWASIEVPGFGKGYVEADLLWQEFMQAASGLRRAKGMTIIIIAHDEIKRIEDPIIGTHDRYSPQLHKRALDIIKKDVDVIAFLNYRMSIKESKGSFNKITRTPTGAGERIIFFSDRPGFVAGNRYSLPDEMPYRRGSGYADFSKAMAQAVPTILPPAVEATAEELPHKTHKEAA